MIFFHLELNFVCNPLGFNYCNAFHNLRGEISNSRVKQPRSIWMDRPVVRLYQFNDKHTSMLFNHSSQSLHSSQSTTPNKSLVTTNLFCRLKIDIVECYREFECYTYIVKQSDSLNKIYKKLV